VNDPLYMGSICSHTASSADERQNSPTNTQDNNEGCCAFCAAGHSSVGCEPPPLIFVSMQRAYQRVVWLKAADAMLTVRFGSNTQARAPPLAA
jgi:hypothetical protein